MPLGSHRERRRLFLFTGIYEGLGALITTSLPLLLSLSGLKWLPRGDCNDQDTTASCDVSDDLFHFNAIQRRGRFQRSSQVLNNRIRFGALGLFFGWLIVVSNLMVARFITEPTVRIFFSRKKKSKKSKKYAFLMELGGFEHGRSRRTRAGPCRSCPQGGASRWARRSRSRRWRG